jgi:two-component system CheB/CheR fusion protein
MRDSGESATRISVVGIGASAGGLEAFRVVLAHIPVDTGLAFVFVQHLDPKHHSDLTEILAAVSAIPFQEAGDGMKIEPDARSHMPINRFMESLAQACGSGGIGVILSGVGTDGAAGLEAVKAAGGVTFAQDPATARFASMPTAAIGSGCVDFILSPEAIAAELTKLASHPYITGEETRSPGTTEELGVQFGTIRRRIMRRSALRNIGSVKEYCEWLRSDPRELSALHGDLLIHVTWGKYAATIAADVRSERLNRYFQKLNGGYGFHYALKPGGFLLLGPSKTESDGLFSAVEGTQDIYAKHENIGRRRPTAGNSGRQRCRRHRRATGIIAIP